MLLMLAAVLGSTLQSRGQEVQDSLMHYLDVAVRNNPTVLQRYYEYQAALQKIPQVGTLPDPTLEMGIFLKPMDIMDGKQIADIKLMQMFPWFGVLKNAKDEMSLMAKAKYESLRDAKLLVVFEMQSNWYTLNRLQQTIKISERNLEVLHTIERLSLVKFRATSGSVAASASRLPSTTATIPQNGVSGMQGMNGTASGGLTPGGTVLSQSMSSPMQGGMGGGGSNSSLSDLYRVQIEIEDLSNSIELLKDQRVTSVAKFNSLLNRSSLSPVILPDTLVVPALEFTAGTVVDSILTNNPMLGMLKYEQMSADAKLKMVRRMGYPMIGVGVNYTVIGKSPMVTSSMNGKDMVMPMLSFTIPLYRKKYKAMESEAYYAKKAVVQSYSATTNLLQKEYYEALQLHLDSQRRLSLYRKQSTLAKKSLDIMIASFSASNSSLTDILKIRQQLFDYEIKEVEALTDNGTAVAWMHRLMAVVQTN